MNENNTPSEVQPVYRTFEEALPIIDKILRSRKGKWTLKAISSMDYDDVSQLCRLHIWKKWNQYDQTQKLEPWVSRIVSRQMINIIRNVYSSFSRPCLKCSENQGGDLCAYTPSNKQCAECPIFSLWENTKKRAFNVKLAVSAENHQQEISEMPDDSIDVERAVKTIHEHLKLVLKPTELVVFEYIYIFHLSDEQIAEKMQYKATENNRKPGYSRISQIKRKILAKVKEIRNDIDIF